MRQCANHANGRAVELKIEIYLSHFVMFLWFATGQFYRYIFITSYDTSEILKGMT